MVKHSNTFILYYFHLESELVSGFMTEHAAVIFVFFFLAEYASIVLICILNSILFIGGYLSNFNLLIFMINEINYMFTYDGLSVIEQISYFLSYPLIEGMLYGLTIGIKSCIMIFTFI